jgi:hypothetical protein
MGVDDMRTAAKMSWEEPVTLIGYYINWETAKNRLNVYDIFRKSFQASDPIKP